MSKKKPKVKPIVKSFNCPKCGAALKITAVGVTVNVVCGSCQSTVDVSHPTLKYIEAHKKSQKLIPDIPLGSRGTFAGHVYECIGFMQKVDSIYYWREYLLFNPYVGFKWLVEVDGHWSITKKVYIPIENSLYQSFKLNDNKYRLFNDSSATVDYVEGEFYWRVKKGDRTFVKDYISPPYMLSFESAKTEKSWSLGRYIESERVQQIFNIKGKLPTPQGIGANQPSSSKQKLRKVIFPLLLSVIAIFAVHSYRVSNALNETVFTQSYYKRAIPKKGEEIKTETFEITADSKNIELKIFTNLRNSWLYLDALLVDSETGKGIPLNIEAQYYAGVSGGESWSEGSRRSKKIAFNIPKGTYFLSLVPQSGGKSTSEISYKVKLTSDIVLMRNWVWALFLVLLYPIWILFRTTSEDRQRWSNSDFSPYGE